MRAVGVVRVSQAKGREGESFVSPVEQRERIEGACKRDGLELVAVHEEIDVSGGAPLERRPGLLAAVEAVESGEADVVMVAYFDRLVRSLKVQEEVVTRTEAGGGRVLAVDIGQVTGATAVQWLQGTMLGAFSEYQRRQAKERGREAQARAVARGVPPFNNIPPGYRQEANGCLVPSEDAPAVRRAFEMRADGATIKEVRDALRRAHIERSHHGVQSLLSSRIVLGEIHFGDLVNTEAHEPIVDRDLWERVQRVKAVRGRRGKSTRLLARLGVLRCGTCGSRMIVGNNNARYPIYRCPPVGDCPRRFTIGAGIAEEVVSEAVVVAISHIEEGASAERDSREADAALTKAQATLDAAISAFSGLESEPAAVQRLRELRDQRDVAHVEAHRLRSLQSVVTRSGGDWERLTLAGRRALIQAVVEVAVVGPGVGAERVTVRIKG